MFKFLHNLFFGKKSLVKIGGPLNPYPDSPPLPISKEKNNIYDSEECCNGECSCGCRKDIP